MKLNSPASRSGHSAFSLGAAAFLLLSIALVAAPAWADAEREVWSVSDLKTSFAFRHDLLDGYGLAIQDIEATGSPLDHAETSVSKGRDVVFAGHISPSLDLEVTRHVPQRFIGTVLHSGGFRLVGSAGNISLAPFSLRSGAEPRTLEILSSDGEVIFFADHMHFSLERDLGRLRSFNLDLRLAPAIAERLEAPALSGVFVGTLALEANFPQRADTEGSCEPDWSGDVDVALINIGRVDSVFNGTGVTGIAPSATLKNVGTADVPWWRKFTGPFPPYNNDQHPYLTWALYRMTDDRIEQLAVSDIKHAFLTLNINCDPGEDCDSHILGLGCEDVYSSGTNDSRSHLSYRDEIESNSALWNGTGSHFDPDDDGTQEHPPQMPDGDFDHRLIVDDAELGTAGASYFMHAFYLIRDDIDIFNSMAYRQVNPTDNGSGSWSFPVVTGTTNGTVLDEWVDPANPGADAANTLVTDGAGTVQLAAKAMPSGDGGVRFEYALQNHDYDPQIDGFLVPLNGEPVYDITFRDIDDDPANDWVVSFEGGNIVWRLPAGAPESPAHTGGTALDWGLMYNFGFTVYGGTTTASRASFEAVNGLGAIRVDSIVPAGDSGVLFADGFESGDVSFWSTSMP